MHFQIFVVYFITTLSGVLARVYEDVSALPHKSYDFVIVGGNAVAVIQYICQLTDITGGTAGLVVANR
jgi:hypothetical protein